MKQKLSNKIKNSVNLSEEEINEGNKLISDFMCEKFKDNNSGIWDWMMPVIEKIETLKFDVNIVLNHCSIKEYQCSFWRAQCTGESKFDGTYKSVIQFIKWYNEQLYLK